MRMKSKSRRNHYHNRKSEGCPMEASVLGQQEALNKKPEESVLGWVYDSQAKGLKSFAKNDNEKSKGTMR